jgi:hypothetical protein
LDSQAFKSSQFPFGGLYSLRASELHTTETELHIDESKFKEKLLDTYDSAIANAANTGFNLTPAGYITPAATGNIATLYIMAHTLCTPNNQFLDLLNKTIGSQSSVVLVS